MRTRGQYQQSSREEGTHGRQPTYAEKHRLNAAARQPQDKSEADPAAVEAKNEVFRRYLNGRSRGDHRASIRRIKIRLIDSQSFAELHQLGFGKVGGKDLRLERVNRYDEPGTDRVHKFNDVLGKDVSSRVSENELPVGRFKL